MNSSDSLSARYQLHFISLYDSYLQLLLCKVGSLQFRTTLSIHTVSSTPGDSSMVLSKFFPSSMVFTHNAKARLPLISL